MFEIPENLKEDMQKILIRESELVELWNDLGIYTREAFHYCPFRSFAHMSDVSRKLLDKSGGDSTVAREIMVHLRQNLNVNDAFQIYKTMKEAYNEFVTKIGVSNLMEIN